MNELVRRASIEELCGHRARALELYQQGIDMLREARRAHARACPSLSHISGVPNDFGRHLNWGDSYISGELKTIRTDLDRDMWKSMIECTALGSLMDRQEREKFEQELKQEPPEVTPETAYATLSRLAGEADLIFRRGLVNAFSRFCRDYKSNDGFKIGERIVIRGGVTYEGWMGFRINYYREPELMDIDRVMHVLDGKPAPEYQRGLCADLRTQFQDKKGPREVKTPYWKAKFFQNGNLHLWCLRADLRAKANKLIAEHFGEVLAAGFEAKQKDPGFTPAPKSYGADDADFFPTPDAVVARMLDVAEIQPEHSVLEPEAGKGHIAKPVMNCLDAKSVLTAVEIDRTKADQLRVFLKTPLMPAVTVVNADFLEMAPEAKFDRVVMNPPFSRGQDIRHVFHAWKFVKPGGRLVAVMPGSIKALMGENASSAIKERAQFGAWLSSLGATVEDLPADSFKASGTGVNTVLVTIDKAAA